MIAAIMLCVVGWLGCGIESYLLFRWDWRKRAEWMSSTRRLTFFMSAFGPISLVAAMLVVFVISPAACGDGEGRPEGDR